MTAAAARRSRRACRRTPQGRGRRLPPAGRGPAGVDIAVLARQHVCASSAICPAISTPVGPAPTTTNVSHASRCRVGRPPPPPPRTRAGSGRAGRARRRASSAPARARPVVVAEIRVPRSAGDREHVVRQRLRASVRQVCDGDVSAPRGRMRSPPEDHTGVLLPAQRFRSGIATSTDESEPVATW